MLDKPLHNTLMMSSNQNMHCLSPRTQVQWSTHTSTYTVHTHTCSWACNACTHKHTLTQSHSCKYTPKHTHYPTHKHTSSVSRTFGIAVCELPSFQGKAWPFTSILVFAYTNCWVVQVYLGTDV